MCEVEVTLPLKLNASGHFEDLYATAAQMMNDVKPALSCECFLIFKHISKSHKPYMHEACDSHVTYM